MSAEAFLGRWDLTVGVGPSSHPAWLEVNAGPDGTLAGRYVGIWGSARPVANVAVDGDEIRFGLPVQYEDYPQDLAFTGRMVDGALVGAAHVFAEGVRWVGLPAPTLPLGNVAANEPPVSLVGEGLAGWHPRALDRENQWANVDGALVNAAVGTDLVSDARFSDFRLVAEYSYPEGSNSGIYLRGRYELQILDDYGQPPAVGASGAIYGFLVPRINAVHPPSQRNVAEITLIGRTITVVLNGETVLDRQEIPGITGGALDSDEGTPGPILLQGDHGPVTFHRLEITRLSPA